MSYCTARELITYPLVEMYELANIAQPKPTKTANKTEYVFDDGSHLVILYNGLMVKHEGEEEFFKYRSGGMMQ